MSGAPATQAELAAVVSGVLGKEVPVQQVDDDAYADIMAKAGVPEGALPIVVGIQQAIREGALDITSSDFAKLLQRPLTPLSAGVSDLLGVKA
ncbi:hypothetical protein D3C81_1963110 [compost metagenome]